MPPKAAADEATLDPFTMFLLHTLSDQGYDIKPTTYYRVLGLSSPKNVGRKVNDYAKPYGYKVDHGKFVKLDGTTVVAPAPASTTKPATKRPTTPATPDSGEDGPDPDESPSKKAKVTKTKAKPKGQAKGGKTVKAETESDGSE